MKNILLTGASGMLGRATADYFSRRKDCRVTATARSFSDYVNAEEFIIADFVEPKFIEKFSARNFDVVIHTAALTDLEKCENDHLLAEKIHIEASAELARQNSQAVFIYISTDSVFDGETGNYAETDVPNPSNYYSQTKLEGEKSTIENAPDHYILRTNIYGFHLPPRRSLFEWGFHQLKRGVPISGFADVFFNPLYIGQLAEVVGSFIDNRPPFGIYNATADEHFSKYEFFIKCAEKLDLPIELIQKSKLPEDESLAVRPRRTFLRNDKIKYNLPNVDLSFESGLNLLARDLQIFEEYL